MAVTAEKMEQGRKVYEQIVEYLHSIKLNFSNEELDDRFIIHFTMNSDGFPMRYFIYINPSNEVITIRSPQSIKFSEDKCVLGCQAVNMVNGRIINGRYELDVKDGRTSFAMDTLYSGGEISNDSFGLLLRLALKTNDKYAMLLMMLGKGMCTLEQFREKISQ